MVRALVLENCREAERKKRCMMQILGRTRKKRSLVSHKIDNMNNEDTEFEL
jgi:hypothetical protein